MKNRRYKKVIKAKRTFQIKNKRMLISLTSIVLIMVTTVALTLAYQTADTNTIVNEFETPEIETSIEETFDGVTKTNVTATNSIDSDVDVYVRLKFVVQTLEAVYDTNGDTVMTDGVNYYSSEVITDDESGDVISLKGTVTLSTNSDGDDVYTSNNTVPTGVDTSTLYYVTGAIVATPSSYDEDGYLLNLPITIVNALEIGGLNVDFTGDGNADWFTDATESTGIYFYKYSLAPGESAYDLITDINQEVFYEDTIVRLTILVDSVQVDGVEDAWENVKQSDDYVDANGNPILYSSTYATGATGVEPKKSYDDYTQRFNYEDKTDDDYDTTLGEDSYGNELTMKFPTDTTTTLE